MEKLILSLLFFSNITFYFCQAPALSWQKCLGGSSNDSGANIQQTTDGGYILVGSTVSTNGDVSGNQGSYDLWVVKVNQNGILQWQKCLGGSSYDSGANIQQTIDGGYILTGTTDSNDGDVSGNHGEGDVWIVKLSESGILLWQKCLGGSALDCGYIIKQTNDGGYILMGSSASNDGDVSGNYNGSEDIWILKMNELGLIEWQKCLGGTAADRGLEIQQTIDGGYILAGYTYSIDGDVIGNDGNNHIWVVKLSEIGILQWQKCLGGTGYLNIGCSIKQTVDEGFVLLGYTNSNDIDVSGNNGGLDFWVAKLSSTGALQWQKCLGGSADDYGSNIQQTVDNGYILVGYTNSNDGDVSGNHGSADVWVVKLNESGTLQWQKCLGGSADDSGSSIQQTLDNGYILVGYTNSNDDDVSGNHGSADVWVVKLIECNSTTNTSSTLNVSSCTSYPTPWGQILTNSGTYTEIIPNHVGCDSTITINFTKYQPSSNNITVQRCGLPYMWNGQSYNSYGNYTQVLQTIHGCDSTVNITLENLTNVQDVCIVGVEQISGKNKVVWEKEQTALISDYNVYRENTQTGSFDLIGSTNYTDSSLFLDINSSPNQQAYRYQIKFVDTCGIERNAGSTHKTIHLTINQGVGTDWNLIWTAYEGITYASYNIYRGTNPSNMSLLTTLPSNLTSYTDASAPSGYVYYQIEIVSPTNCNPSKSMYNNSRSNISSNDLSLGINKNTLESFLIYPNPAKNQFQIDFDGQINKLEIIDAKGALIYTTFENKEEYMLPNHIQMGYYLVVIHTDEGIFRKELLIEK